MNIPRLLVTATICLIPSCYDESVAELGVYNGAQGGDTPPVLGDASLLIPFGDASLPTSDLPTVDPSLTCTRFVAHAPGSSEGYPVVAGESKNVLFTFRPPWQGVNYIRRVAPIIDEQVALHHWLLYADPRDLGEGVNEASTTSQPGSLVYGWIPGSTPIQLSNEQGIAVRSDVSYTLAVRYSNLSGPDVRDASGVEVCWSSRPAIFGVSLTLLEAM